jgi:hypothetical protein
MPFAIDRLASDERVEVPSIRTSNSLKIMSP